MSKNVRRAYPDLPPATTPIAGTDILAVHQGGRLKRMTPLGFGPLTCTTFTSIGIDDNATGERLNLADTTLTYGATGVDFGVVNAAGDKSLTISGGIGILSGANIQLYGATHPTLANDLRFRSGATNQLYYDDSASSWDFQANAIITTGSLNCGALTSTGIDDNATSVAITIDSSGDIVFPSGTQLYWGASTDSFIQGFSSTGAIIYDVISGSGPFHRFKVDGADRLLIYDGYTRLGGTAGDYHIRKAGNDNWLGLSGGNNSNVGGNIVLYGGAHATLANDIIFRSGSGNQLYYDDSGSTWNLKANTLIWDITTQDLPFINFVATADADSTSAISTLTTSGSTTHHVQVEINGTKAWIAVSTNAPT